jgi:hypothetical protein
MANSQLHAAKNAKNDEFYTQYEDIEREMNAYIEFNKNVFRDKTILLPCDDPEWSNFTKYFAANFERFGIKKLVSTSYAKSSGNRQISLFELNSPQFDENKHDYNGKLFILERDVNGSGRIDQEDIEFSYLQGDGDFRSDEVTKLRDEADIIITNPPFSLFREFIAWIREGNKQFAVIANQNVYTYNEIFVLIKNNELWAGTHAGDMAFKVPANSEPRETRYWEDATGQKWRSIGNATWLTNIEHGRRHTKQQLMTMEENLKYNKTLIRKLMKEYGELKYPQYDNIDAIEVPVTEAIPSDYDGYMGVPITFIDKYNPEQFEIVDALNRYTDLDFFGVNDDVQRRHSHCCNINGKAVYKRIVIHKRG